MGIQSTGAPECLALVEPNDSAFQAGLTKVVSLKS